MMTRSTWQFVSQLTELHELNPIQWDTAGGVRTNEDEDSGIEEAEWIQLGKFNKLHNLALRCPRVPWNIIFPILITLSSLHTLLIDCGEMTITPSEMMQLFSLPLQSLTLICVRMDFAVLSQLPTSCHTLRMKKCSNMLCTRPFQPLIDLPPLLHVHILEVQYVNTVASTMKENELLKHKFIQRCPNLHDAKFTIMIGEIIPIK